MKVNKTVAVTMTTPITTRRTSIPMIRGGHP